MLQLCAQYSEIATLDYGDPALLSRRRLAHQLRWHANRNPFASPPAASLPGCNLPNWLSRESQPEALTEPGNAAWVHFTMEQLPPKPLRKLLILFASRTSLASASNFNNLKTVTRLNK
jgi:hypothetical protein